MSRIGRKPINIPNQVKASIQDGEMTVVGPKGKLSQKLPEVDSINIAIEDGSIVITRNSDNRKIRALHGLTRALIANMVNGVSQGFTKTLRIAGFRL